MKKLVFLILLFPLYGSQFQLDDLKDRVMKFEIVYDQFVRKLYGCQKTGELNHQTCFSGNSQVDYALYEKSRKAAKNLFP